MAQFDKIAEAKGDAEYADWVKRLTPSMDVVVDMVARERGRGLPKEVVRYYRSSFNAGARISFEDDGPEAVIHYAKFGVTAFQDDKVRNEVEVIRCLAKHTSVSVPHIIA